MDSGLRILQVTSSPFLVRFEITLLRPKGGPVSVGPGGPALAIVRKQFRGSYA
jgi:hypothetical protein